MIWGNTYVTNIRCITVLQKRVVRLFCGANRLEHTNTPFKHLIILKCVDLIKFKTAIIMYNAYHNVLPNSLQNMSKLYVSTHGTRQKDTFRSHRVRTSITSMCISVFGETLWRSQHENITSCRSRHTLNKSYKLHLLSMY